ncbi:MAG: YdbH domain-containing protein, partial [Gammaproteobacteria bacterium]|nr:YdbH domain-containing protein [Gammaproteobacteria bacterium]
MRYLIVFSIVLAMMSTGVYLGSSSLIGLAAPHFAETLGVDEISVTTSRPGLDSIEIESFLVRVDGAEVVGSYGKLTYDLYELLDGKFQSLRFTTVDVTVNPHSDDTSIPDPDGPPFPSAVFAVIPVTELTIDVLTLSVVRLGFVGRGALQLSKGRLAFDMNGLEPTQAEHFKVEGKVDDTGAIQVRFLDTDFLDDPFLIVNSTVEKVAAGAQVTLDMKFKLTDYALQLASELAGIPPGEGTLKGDVHTELPWPVTDTTIDSATLNGTFDLNWRDAEDRVRFSNLRGDFRGQLGSIDAMLAGGDIKIGGPALSMTFPPGYPVNYRNTTLTMGAGMTFTFVMGDVASYGKLRSLEAQLGSGLIADLDVDLSASGFDLATHGRAIVHAEVKPGSERLAGRVDWMFDDIELTATFSHHFGEGRGSLSANQEIAVNAPLLAGVFENWSLPYDVTTGQISAEMDLSWFRERPVQGTVSLALSQLDATFEDYSFDDISGNLLIRFADAGVELAPSSIVIDRADIGLDLTDISLRAARLGDVLTIEGMEMQLLGGSATFSPITFDSNQPATRIDVELNALSLAEVLALEGDDIKGSGKLSGRLPIEINEGLVSMTNGKLSSEHGGIIQLSTDFGVETGQLGLDFAMQALTNFSYSKLDVSADYAENGDLALTVNLQGTNPEVEKGR